MCVGVVECYIHLVHIYVICEDALNIAFVGEIPEFDDILNLFDNIILIV